VAGAERAAKLTDQLLSFSRRQPLQPDRHQLNDLVENLRKLVERTLDPAIHVESNLDAALWPTIVDANQTENAILNLITNARDAMPHGGTLTLRTFNVPSGSVAGAPDGDHVGLEVSDTGMGIDAATLDHVFEPFFTTKGPGHGTGLGLSQVHGFVNQSKGYIDISSVPGAGTTIRLLLPRSR